MNVLSQKILITAVSLDFGFVVWQKRCEGPLKRFGFVLWWRRLLDFLSRSDGGEAVLIRKTQVEEMQFQFTFRSRIPSLQSARFS